MGIEPIFPDRKSGVLTNYTNGAFRSKAIVLLASTLTFIAVLTRFELATPRETVGHSSR